MREEGFGCGYAAVKRFVRGLTQQADLPFQRIEVKPGVEAQVDLGQGAFWLLLRRYARRATRPG